jgi:Sigma-70, region 4
MVKIQEKATCYQKSKQKNRQQNRRDQEDLVHDNFVSVFEDSSFEASIMFREQSLEIEKSSKDLRAKEIHNLRQSGSTLKELGVKYGITRERVRQIEIKHARRQVHLFDQQMMPVKEMLKLFKEVSDQNRILNEFSINFVDAILFILSVRLWQIRIESRVKRWKLLALTRQFFRLIEGFESTKLMNYFKSNISIFVGTKDECQTAISNHFWYQYPQNSPQIFQSKVHQQLFAVAFCDSIGQR